MRIIVEYKPEFVMKIGEKIDRIKGKTEYENVKSVVDGPDLFPDFIEIRTENDENGGRKRVYIARETIKKFEIHEK